MANWPQRRRHPVQSTGLGQRRQTLQVVQLSQNITVRSGTWEAQYTALPMNETTPEPLLGDIHAAPPTHDPVACRRWWLNPCGQMSPAWLHDEVARRMQERLAWIKLQPRDWLHVNPSLGGWAVHEAIVQRYPKARAHLCEPSASRLELARTGMQGSVWHRLNPWRQKPHWHAAGRWPEAVDMVWANMQLHLHHQPPELLRWWHQMLRVDGFVMFSCLGPDSLNELRQLYDHMGWPAAGAEWTDMHDWGDMLVQAGFAEPVMDMERITLSYRHAEAMLTDLRALGRNVHPRRFPVCRGKGWRASLEQAIQNHWPRRSQDGQLLLTFEIVYGHAMRAPDRHRVDTTTRIPLGEMKKMLRPG